MRLPLGASCASTLLLSRVEAAWGSCHCSISTAVSLPGPISSQAGAALCSAPTTGGVHTHALHMHASVVHTTAASAAASFHDRNASHQGCGHGTRVLVHGARALNAPPHPAADAIKHPWLRQARRHTSATRLRLAYTTVRTISARCCPGRPSPPAPVQHWARTHVARPTTRQPESD